MCVLLRRYLAAEASHVIPIWPFLAVLSTDFRHEMRAALFGRDPGMVRRPAALQSPGNIAVSAHQPPSKLHQKFICGDTIWSDLPTFVHLAGWW